jgi:hypothetical protein
MKDLRFKPLHRLRSVRLAAVLIAGLVSGCRPAKIEAQYDVVPDTIKSADLPPAKSLVIEFETHNGVAITAALVKTADADLALKAVELGKSPEQAVSAAKYIAMQNGASGKLTTPNNTERTMYSVLFYAKKPTRVTLRTVRK